MVLSSCSTCTQYMCMCTVQALYTCVQCQYKVCVCILSIIQMKHIKNSMMDAGSMFKMFTAGVAVCLRNYSFNV